MMPTSTPCPRCGASRPPDAPEGLCPECLLRLAWASDLSAGPGRSGPLGGRADPTMGLSASGTATRLKGVLETLTEFVGPAPRVLLRDTDPISGPGPFVRPASPEMPEPSERTGRLQLLGEIARGGMGAVLKGRDNDLGRDLAVKVLLERHGKSPELLRRFVEEAQIAGQLQHPGVVPVYELGTFADHRPFFTMKLVKGRTLSALLEARRDPADDRPRFLAIFEQVCQTMAYAHARGVIHRDLKPSNVMVGSFGEVQVMDWGLAKVLASGGVADDERSMQKSDESMIHTVRSGSDADASCAGSVLGTPAYMAPEQARGEIEDLDERADVFGLGAILCEILTGQPPYVGRSAVEVQKFAARADLDDAMARLDACGADAEVQALARRCLAPEPRHRPREAGEVALAIRHYLDGVQDRLRRAELSRVEAQARAEEEVKRRLLADELACEAQARAAEERKRRRVTLALAASVLVILTLGGGGAFWYVQQRQTLLGRAAIVLREAEVLRDQAHHDPSDDPEKWRAASAALRRADDLLGDTPDATSRARRDALARQVADGLRDAERDRRMLERLEQIHADFADHKDRALKDVQYAEAFRDYGIDVDALGPAEVGARIASRRIAPELAGSLDHWVYNRQFRTPPDAEGARRLSAAARAADPDPWRNQLRDLFDARFDAMLDARLDRKAALLEELRKLAATADIVRLPVASVQRLSDALSTLGDPQESLPLLEAVYRVHPENFAIVEEFHKAFVSMKPPRQAEALRYATVMVSLRPRSGINRAILARRLSSMGRSEAALGQAEEALRLKPDNFFVLEQVSQVYQTEGATNLARSLLLESLARLREEKRLKPDPQAHYRIGTIYMGWGRLDESVAELREATRLKVDFGEAHCNLGDVLRRRGEYAEALTERRRGHELGSQRPDWPYPSARWVRQAERLASLAPRLPSVLRGADRPSDTAERLEFAQMAYDTKNYAGSARLFGESLREKPDLAADRGAEHPYNAACAAALAADGQGGDAPPPDDGGRPALRRQALEWLSAERDVWAKALEAAPTQARTDAIRALRHWKVDPDLVSVRDPEALAKLPEAERTEWRALWAEVDAVLDRANVASARP